MAESLLNDLPAWCPAREPANAGHIWPICYLSQRYRNSLVMHSPDLAAPLSAQKHSWGWDTSSCIAVNLQIQRILWQVAASFSFSHTKYLGVNSPQMESPRTHQFKKLSFQHFLILLLCPEDCSGLCLTWTLNFRHKLNLFPSRTEPGPRAHCVMDLKLLQSTFWKRFSTESAFLTICDPICIQPDSLTSKWLTCYYRVCHWDRAYLKSVVVQWHQFLNYLIYLFSRHCYWNCDSLCLSNFRFLQAPLIK